MIELLVRIVDKIGETPKQNAQLTKRGDVIAWHYEGESWGIQELTNSDWRIIKADISANEADALLASEHPPDLSKEYQTLQRRALKLDLDSIGIDTADIKERVDSKQPQLTKQKILANMIVKEKLPEPDIIGPLDNIIGPKIMPTDVISKIGATNSPVTMDYSTLQAWEDACPANLVTSDQRWIGECYDQGELIVSGTTLTISGQTVDSTRYIILRCATGASFKDKANVRTTALDYNSSNGVGIRNSITSGYYGYVIIISTNNTRIDGLQFKCNQHSSAFGINITGSSCQVDNCICTSRQRAFVISGSGSVLKNSLAIVSDSSRQAVYFTGTALSIYGCTIIKLGAVGATGVSLDNYTVVTAQNCVVLNFTTAFSKNASSTLVASYCATDLNSIGSISSGTNNIISIVFSNQVQNTSNDFRSKIGCDLIAGAPDATNLSVDISNKVRSLVRITIGCWELDAQDKELTSLIPRKTDLINLQNPINRSCGLNRGLVSWWLGLSNIKGRGKWRDLCNRNHGLLTNMDAITDWVPAHRQGGSYCLDFDGVNDWVSVDGSNSLDTTGKPYSISYWAKSVGGTGSYDIHILHDQFDSHTYLLRAQTTGYLERYNTFSTGFVLLDNLWYHITYTFDAAISDTSGTERFYVNGNLVASRTGTVPASPAANTVWRIGMDSSGAHVMQGQMDDIRIWINRSLNATEARQVYLDSKNGYQKTLNRVVHKVSIPPLQVAPADAQAIPISKKTSIINLANPVNKSCGLNRGLVSWWLGLSSLKGRGVWSDLCKRNSGLLTNMDAATDWVPARRRGGTYCLDFDGSNDTVSCGSSANNSSVTISVWFRATSALTSRYTLVSLNDNGGTMDVPMLEVGPGSGSTSRVAVITTGVFQAETVDNSITTNTWYHVVYTKNGNGATHSIYINGVAQALVTNTSASYATTVCNRFIGAREGTYQYFPGQIDDVRIYNRAISTSEVRQLYKDSLSGYPNTLNRYTKKIWSLPGAADSGGSTPTSHLLEVIFNTVSKEQNLSYLNISPAVIDSSFSSSRYSLTIAYLLSLIDSSVTGNPNGATLNICCYNISSTFTMYQLNAINNIVARMEDASCSSSLITQVLNIGAQIIDGTISSSQYDISVGLAALLLQSIDSSNTASVMTASVAMLDQFVDSSNSKEELVGAINFSLLNTDGASTQGFSSPKLDIVATQIDSSQTTVLNRAAINALIYAISSTLTSEYFSLSLSGLNIQDLAMICSTVSAMQAYVNVNLNCQVKYTGISDGKSNVGLLQEIGAIFASKTASFGANVLNVGLNSQDTTNGVINVSVRLNIKANMVDATLSSLLSSLSSDGAIEVPHGNIVEILVYINTSDAHSLYIKRNQAFSLNE